ncbi:MAG: hypothetical protein JW709_00855 [Sedimentisphaerales bacterium]|nr:hypothetical protein [Sedimentisphaerales bacterium]
MKPVVIMMTMMLLVMAGCENQDLINCREELVTSQQQLADQKEATETMVNLAMQGAKTCQEQLEAEIAQHQQTKTQLAQAQTQAKQTQMLQKQVDALKAENAAINDKLVQSKQMMTAASELMKQQAEAQKAEIAALQEANKKLTEELKQLKPVSAPTAEPAPVQ